MSSLSPFEKTVEADLLQHFSDDADSQSNLLFFQHALRQARLTEKLKKAQWKPILRSLNIKSDTDARIKSYIQSNNLTYTEFVNIVLEDSLDALNIH